MAKEYALDDRKQLYKGANQVLDENLAPDEHVKVIIRGTLDSAMMGTDRRVFVFKMGFMAGATFGHKFTSWDYRNIVGIQIETGLLTGFVVIQAPGTETADGSYWSTGKNSPDKSPGAVPIHRYHFKQARKGVALLRLLISESQMQGSPANVSTSQDIPGKIKQLAELHEQGILTTEEFQAKKSELLARI